MNGKDLEWPRATAITLKLVFQREAARHFDRNQTMPQPQKRTAPKRRPCIAASLQKPFHMLELMLRQ
jgi:hypothetical protein